MVPDHIIEMIQKIYYYFPIGIPEVQKSYPGYKKVKDIVNEKIVSIQEEKQTSWSSLIDKISNKVNKEALFDKAYMQYPSYSLSIKLEYSELNKNKRTSSIHLVISLLVNFYTIFFSDLFVYNEFDIGMKFGNPPMLEIIYFKKNVKQEYSDMIEILKEFVSRDFPKHTYVNHKDLFDYRINDGIIYGTELVDKYSIYEYLFSNEFFYDDKMAILE